MYNSQPYLLTIPCIYFFLPQQVIDWLNNHGDVFLKKNTSIGKTLQRAKALQKSHEHFESVARVSEFYQLCLVQRLLVKCAECRKFVSLCCLEGGRWFSHRIGGRVGGDKRKILIE